MRHVIILNLLYSGYSKLNKKVSVKILNLHLFAFAITHLAFHWYEKYPVDRVYEAPKFWDKVDELKEGVSKKTGVHSFRRTFATRLAEQMIPYEFIQRLLGHHTDDITEHYIKYSPKMRKRFYNYVELIVGDQEIEMVLEWALIVNYLLRAHITHYFASKQYPVVYGFCRKLL